MSDMKTIHLNHSTSYSIVIHDPRSAAFSVVLYPCDNPDCIEEGLEQKYCCRGTFVPLTEDAMKRLRSDWNKLKGNISIGTIGTIGTNDIECRLLGEVMGTVTIEKRDGERDYSVDRLIPLMIRRCAAEAMYEMYIRTVPEVVDMLEAEGMKMPRARSIINRGDGRPVGDDSSH